MTKNNLQQFSYAMVFDKERDLCLTILINVLKRNPLVAMELHNALEGEKLNKVFNGMITESDQKSHELGFCTDPKCTYKKKI